MTQTKLNKSVILTIISMGFFLVSLDVTVVNVALSTLKQNLDVSVSGLQWTIDAYTIAFATLLLSAGKAGDIAGPKKVFCIGLVIFSGASLLCGIAQSFSFLILSRVLQGTGAALLVANSLSLIQGVFPVKTEQAKAFAIWGGVGGVAIAIGPVAGGILISEFGWPSAFFLNIPAGILSLVMAIKYIPERDRISRKTNLPAQLLIAIALGCLACTFISAGSDGWISPAVIISAAGFFCAIAGFVIAEIYSDSPLIPEGIFRIKKFTAATSVGLIINAGFYGQLFIVSLYFQQIKQYSTLNTGLALLPQAIVMAVTAFCCGRIMSRVGPGKPILAGLTISFAGMLCLSFLPADSTLPGVMIPMLLTGLGMSLTAPATVAACMAEAPRGQGGITSGIVNAARQSGSVIGVAVAGSFMANHNLSLQSMHMAFLATLPGYLLAIGLTLRWILPGINMLPVGEPE